ncbi:Immunoglobulin-like domain BIg-containing protein, partial [Salmonella enterica]|uniref:Immunoglobulin-like domain BIg-containing protein n=1 Tax=Salmonella enterica TaxID=28901 RepID=UPI00398C53CF
TGKAAGKGDATDEKGERGELTGQPNGVTGEAKERVAGMEGYVNDDQVIKNAEAKVGEKVKMNIHSRNAFNGMAIGNTDFTITMAHVRLRDGLTTGFTDSINRWTTFDEVCYVAGPVYSWNTGAHVNATIPLTRTKAIVLCT